MEIQKNNNNSKYQCITICYFEGIFANNSGYMEMLLTKDDEKQEIYFKIYQFNI